MKKIYIEYANKAVTSLGIEGDAAMYTEMIVLLVFFTLVSALMWWIARNIGLSILSRISKKTKTKLDDYMVKRKVFSALAHIVPLLMMDYFFEVIFHNFDSVKFFMQKANNVVNVYVILIASLRFLNAVRDTLEDNVKLQDKPINSFVQLGKILISGFLIIIMLSIITNQNPVVFLTALGTLTAVLILVFKDTILGFIGSIQLAANDMVRIGDWVTVEKFGADGDVIEINLTTVKVQNFDKTITTVPTYSFIADSFRNWRGMTESGGRRIKRAINVEIGSVKLCDQKMLDKFRKYELIRTYIEEKEAEIQKYNEENKFDRSVQLNGRNQTNIGLFRIYIEKYINSLSTINHEMTCMVRQLESSEKGLPIEIYAFSKSKEWAIYEQTMADIFDHIFATAQFFELELFENPSGSDLRSLSLNK